MLLQKMGFIFLVLLHWPIWSVRTEIKAKTLKIYYKANVFVVFQANQRGQKQGEEPPAVIVITGFFKGETCFLSLFSVSD